MIKKLYINYNYIKIYNYFREKLEIEEGNYAASIILCLSGTLHDEVKKNLINYQN